MRITKGIAVAGAAAVGLVSLAGAPANAAWTKTFDLHGAHAYACKISHGKTATIRYRIDARHSATWVSGGIDVETAKGKILRSLDVRAKAHKKSKTRSIVVSKTAHLSTGIGDANGGMGGGIALSDIKRC